MAAHFRFRREAGDVEHPKYQAAQEEAQWVGKSEGADYVRCLACGLRVLTLARHLKAEHKINAVQYRAAYGEDAKIRCDTLKAKRSVALSTCVRVKGDKKEVTCSSCGEVWLGSKFLALGTHDFRCVDCREIEGNTALQIQWDGKSEPQDYVTCRACGDYRAENLTSHIQSAHSDLVGTYKEEYPGSFLVALSSGVRNKIAIRGVPRPKEFGIKISMQKLAQRVYLTESDLLPFRKKTSKKVSLSRASLGTGLTIGVVKRECLRLGLPYHRLNVSQDILLSRVSTLLGYDYKSEWTSSFFVNPKSGHRFKFDGYFEACTLLIEFQGYQHYTWPNHFHSHEAAFLEARERDVEKRRQALAHGGFKYLEVREDQPWQDLDYLRKRLTDLEVPTVS